MATKTFTGTRAPAQLDLGLLASWHLSNGATAAATVTFCEEVSGAPVFQVQLPISASSSQSYAKPLATPGGGRWHVEVAGGPLNRGAIDLI